MYFVAIRAAKAQGNRRVYCVIKKTLEKGET